MGTAITAVAAVSASDLFACDAASRGIALYTPDTPAPYLAVLAQRAPHAPRQDHCYGLVSIRRPRSPCRDYGVPYNLSAL
jgi:hypothetical protein